MLNELLFLAGAGAHVPMSFVSGSVVTATETRAGACVIPDPSKPFIASPSPTAQLVVTWEEQDGSDEYEAWVYLDDVLLAQYAAGVETHTYDVPFGVKNASGSPVPVSVFRVDIVRVADSVAIFTKSAAPVAGPYAECEPEDVGA